MQNRRALALVLSAMIVVIVARPSLLNQTYSTGDLAVAVADADVLSTIPVGLFHDSQVVGVVRQGEQVIVLDVREINTVVQRDQWLRVRSAETGVEGWVFNGQRGGELSFARL